MTGWFRSTAIVLFCTACSGCLHHAITRPEDLSTNHDQVETFTVQRPFDEVHAAVSKTAAKCYEKKFAVGTTPAVSTSTVHREIDDRLLEPSKLALVAVVVRGGPWPMGPEDYFLRVDIKALSPSETEITTYNASAVRAQRAFHKQVRRWVVDSVEDCSGTGLFDG